MKSAIAVLAVVALLGVAASASAHHAAPDPQKFESVQSALTTDVMKLNSDLHREKTDARAGPAGAGEPACYNLVNNVDNDVRAIANFVQSNVTSDLANMQNDINAMRRDRADFNNDIADFINDGVPRPSGAAAATLEISAKITRAKAEANRTIDLLNAAVAAAYSIGNGMATGSCSGDGPGSPSASIQHIT